MNIAIETRMLDFKLPFTGIAQYINNLLIQLSKIDNKNNYLLISDTPLRKELMENIGPNFKSIYSDKFINKGWKIWLYEHYLHQMIDKYNPDVLWSPGIITTSTSKNIKHVYNIHDLIRIELKDKNNKYIYSFKQRLFFNYYLNKGLKYSNDLIFLTNDVKNKVNKLYSYKIKNKKEHIIYPSIQFKKRNINYKNINPKILELINSDDKYLFFIGTKERRKGIYLMLDLAKKMKNNKINIPYKIVLAGADLFGFDDFHEEVKHLDNIIDFKQISEDEKAVLYQNCTAVLYPSLLEGFGIPLLEGAFYNKPIIASDLPVFKEVMGNNYFSFKTGDSNSLLSTVSLFYHNDLIRDHFVNSAHKILNKYNIENETEKLYHILTS